MKDVYANEGELDHDENVHLLARVCVSTACAYVGVFFCWRVYVCVCVFLLLDSSGQSLVPVETRSSTTTPPPALSIL